MLAVILTFKLVPPVYQVCGKKVALLFKLDFHLREYFDVFGSLYIPNENNLGNNLFFKLGAFRFVLT